MSVLAKIPCWPKVVESGLAKITVALKVFEMLCRRYLS